MEVTCRGKSILWPYACACCLQSPDENLQIRQTRILFLGILTYRRTLSVPVPYCELCAERIRERSATPWGSALLVFLCLYFGGAYVIGSVDALGRSLSAMGVLALGALLLLGSFVGARLFVLSHRHRELGPLPGDAHCCDRGHAVEIVTSTRDGLVLSVHNERFAHMLEAATRLGETVQRAQKVPPRPKA